MPDVALETALDDRLSRAVDARLAKMEQDEVIPRIWRRDHTVWRPDPTEISDRLGWLNLPHTSAALIPDLLGLAEEAAEAGLTHALLLGMGGSSLAPEVFRRSLGVAPGALDLRVLDSTHPDAVAAVEEEIPLDRTLFVVSSKSGTTIETRSHLAYFHSLVGDGSRFVAITDPGSPLESEAAERGFRRVLKAAPDVGGRYSALTAFGLLPAALIGADLAVLLGSAAEAAASCGGGHAATANPGAALGAIMGEAALAGRDKLTILSADPVSALGAWLEQLVAESTGKDGKGIVPVDLEPFHPATADRTNLVIGGDTPSEPWARLQVDRPDSLGAAMFVLEFATAVAGHVLGIHPFDQPDVQSAKDRTGEALKAPPAGEPGGDIDEMLGTVRPGDYVGIQAFVAPSAETWESLQSARRVIGERLEVATTLGYGPRYLHSTGQLHKGGPPAGVFLQVIQEPADDRDIPGEDYSFGRLIAAQAAGDLAALRERGRRVARVSLDSLLAWGSG
ncbi:MAG: glucose-6-phosphate isomerase [Actinomycetota bacterium]